MPEIPPALDSASAASAAMPADPAPVADTAVLRKARGAFFTPSEITRHIAGWAVRGSEDRVLEPSAGDAAFLTAAVERLRGLGAEHPPRVHGVEIHEHSARLAAERVGEVGGEAEIVCDDFFAQVPERSFDAVIGNPPFIRYQDFSGEARDRSREAALAAGVPLSRLASSWAAFAIHATSFLKPGGRLGLVLPAELLSVNYAGPVRRFLFERFADVELVMFDAQVFPEAQADVVLVLAEGFDAGPAEVRVRQVADAAALASDSRARSWRPSAPEAKWTSTLIAPEVLDGLDALGREGVLTELEQWGDTTLGMVTGANRYFALSPERAARLGIPAADLLRLSPPGSEHLRGLSLSADRLRELGRGGAATWLFRPRAGRPLHPASAAYIASGEDAGIPDAYKCRIRTPWYRVPLVPPADLLLTCMNADAPRIVRNTAGAHHLNSVHGVYLRPEHAELVDLLPLAALSSISLLSAELVGRSYGGGVLKLEPREADRWAVVSPDRVAARSRELRALAARVRSRLGEGDLPGAAAVVDAVLLDDLPSALLAEIRDSHARLMRRRIGRGRRGR